MRCPRCGKENAPNAARCVKCNTPFYGPYSRINLPNQPSGQNYNQPMPGRVPAQNQQQRRPVNRPASAKKSIFADAKGKALLVSIISLSLVLCIIVGLIAIPPIFEGKKRSGFSGGGGGGGIASWSSGYALSFAAVENGKVNTSVTGRYEAGSAISLQATANEGYVFSSWSSSAGGTFENSTSAETTFTMPENDVIISAVFVDKEGAVSAEVAALFGFDAGIADADGDGLNNYDEIHKTATHPAVADSDEDGVNDADEDSDEDQLTNKEEIELGTDPLKKDSDNDGLFDYDEVKTHKTNPCNYDTDGDGLCDGDEIILGLDPLKPKTDGKTPDAERTFTQNLDKSNISEILISESSTAVPSFTLIASGNVNKNTTVNVNDSSEFDYSRAIIGEPVELIGETIVGGTLTFTMQNEGVDSVVEADSKETYDISLICKYGEDGTTQFLETTTDAKAKTLTANIDGEGTYFVMNVKNLFDELGLEMPKLSGYSAEKMSTKHIGSMKDTFSNTDKIDFATPAAARAQADIIFVIDTTGSMGEEINNVKENISAFVDFLEEKGISAALGLVEYKDIIEDGYDSTKVHKNGTSNWFYDVGAYKSAIAELFPGGGGDGPECVVDALETARLLDMRTSAGKIFVLVTDSTYKNHNRYEISNIQEEINLLKNAEVSCCVISRQQEKEEYEDLYTQTNGLWADIYGNFQIELMNIAEEISDKIVGDGFWIYLNGPVPVPVRLDAQPASGSSVDTDKDGVPDIKELKSIEPSGTIDLDKIITITSHGAITGTSYGKVATYEYNSNPIIEDTDFDGINDDKDTLAPKDNDFEATLFQSINEGINVKYKMDYRYMIQSVNPNTVYNQELSSLGIIYSMLAYGGSIKFTSGIKTEKLKIEDCYKLFGVADVERYDLKNGAEGYPAIEDDDVTEVIIGHKRVKYKGDDHEIVIVSVRGTNGTLREWSSNFDVGANDKVYWDYKNLNWKNHSNHKGFDVAANRVNAYLENYIKNKVDSSAKKSIYIVGHSRGAAIANILGSIYTKKSDITTYVYGFATPNTTTDSSAESYNGIYSIVNKDDIVPQLPLDAWGFSKYGKVKAASVAEEYENSWFSAQEGTWEWLINANREDKLDYNFNGNAKETIESFGKIIKKEDSPEGYRKKLYQYPEKKYVWEHNQKYNTIEEANSAKEKLIENYGTRIGRFAEVYVEQEGKHYKVKAKQSPAFLTMVIADMASGDESRGRSILSASDIGVEHIAFSDIKLGFDVAEYYKDAKKQFLYCALDSVSLLGDGKAGVGLGRFGGMTHGHWPETYYLLARFMK